MAASRVACASFNLGTNTTISITRDDSSYTHSLSFVYGDISGDIVQNTKDTTYVWSLSDDLVDRFYNQIPNATSRSGTIYCSTYDASGNKVGDTTITTFYAYAVKDDCLPSVEGSVVDTNESTIAVTGDSAGLVRYMSKPKCTLSATAKKGAFIKSYLIENTEGLFATSSPFTFDKVYDKEFEFKAIDSRGYSTTSVVNVEKFIEYTPCYILKAPMVERTESTSTTATTTLVGYCYNGSFGVVNNTLTIKYRYKKGNSAYGEFVEVDKTWNKDGSYIAEVSIPNLSLDGTYNIEFVVEDKLTSFVSSAILGQGVGDLRIAEDHVLTKNSIIIGSTENTEFKPLRVRRKVNEDSFRTEFGVSDESSAVIQLLKNNDGYARIDLKDDGHLYNALSNMSFAELMSYTSESQGCMVLNGGGVSPILMQWGKLCITPLANQTTSQLVKFPNEYEGIPMVLTDGNIAPSNITSSKFNANLKIASVKSTLIQWIAIGNASKYLKEKEVIM